MTNDFYDELTLIATMIVATEGLALWKIPRIFEAEKKNFNNIGASSKNEVDAMWENIRQKPNFSGSIIIRLFILFFRIMLRKCCQKAMQCGLRTLIGLCNCLNSLTHLLIYSTYFTVPILALYILNLTCRIIVMPSTITQSPKPLATIACGFLACKFTIIFLTYMANRLFLRTKFFVVISPTNTDTDKFTLLN